MNLQEELKTLKERIAELEVQVEKKQAFPRNGDDYWYIVGNVDMTDAEWDGGDWDQVRMSVGNVFKTKEQAEFAVEKLKVEAELRKFSRPFEYGKTNYHFFFDIDGNSFRTDFTSYCPLQGAIYFESEEKTKQAISTVGVDRIKKYIFGVEDL